MFSPLLRTACFRSHSGPSASICKAMSLVTHPTCVSAAHLQHIRRPPARPLTPSHPLARLLGCVSAAHPHPIRRPPARPLTPSRPASRTPAHPVLAPRAQPLPCYLMLCSPAAYLPILSSSACRLVGLKTPSSPQAALRVAGKWFWHLQRSRTTHQFNPAHSSVSCAPQRHRGR